MAHIFQMKFQMYLFDEIIFFWYPLHWNFYPRVNFTKKISIASENELVSSMQQIIIWANDDIFFVSCTRLRLAADAQ